MTRTFCRIVFALPPSPVPREIMTTSTREPGLMKPAAEKLAEALQDVVIRTPQIRVIHNADVAAYDDADKIKDALVRQLYSPVRWTETVNALVAEGIAESAECGPGKVLAGLAKRINKEAACTALTNAEQVAVFIEAH